MANFATNYTTRVVYSYTSNGRNHTTMMRTADASTATIEANQGVMLGLLVALKSLLPSDFQIKEVNVYPAGETNSYPVDIIPALASFGGGTVNPDKVRTPNFLSFVGRTLAGSRVNLFLYGVTMEPGGVPGKDWRLLATESTQVAAAINALTEEPPPALVGIDGGAVRWKQYANYGVSAYWQRKERA